MTFAFGILLFTFNMEPTTTPQTEIMALNDEMKAFLAASIEPTNDPGKRLESLVNAIFNEQFLNLTYDNSRTRTAEETFAARNGNCLSFTLMFVAMARHIGLDAKFQEVENQPTWNKRGDLVVLSRHINATVMLPGRMAEVDFNPYAERREFIKKVVPDTRAFAQFYNNLGAELFSSRQFQDAIPYFKKAVDISPTLSFAWSNLGVAYKNTQHLAMAEMAYQEAIRLDPREYTAMVNLATLYRDTGRIDEANAYLEKVDRFRRKNPYYHFHLGERAFADGRYEDALSHYKDATRRKTKEHEFHFAIAKAYARLGQIERASQALAKARDFAPDLFNETRYSQKLEKLAVKN